MLVTPPQPFFRATTAQRSINRCRRDKDLTVPIDVNDRALKLFRRDFRKAFRDLLVGCVLNFSASDYAPALDPAPAKVTFAIPNQERLGQGIGNAELLFHELSGGSHVPSRDITQALLVIPSAVEESLTIQKWFGVIQTLFVIPIPQLRERDPTNGR